VGVQLCCIEKERDTQSKGAKKAIIYGTLKNVGEAGG